MNIEIILNVLKSNSSLFKKLEFLYNTNIFCVGISGFCILLQMLWNIDQVSLTKPGLKIYSVHFTNEYENPHYNRNVEDFEKKTNQTKPNGTVFNKRGTIQTKPLFTAPAP